MATTSKRRKHDKNPKIEQFEDKNEVYSQDYLDDHLSSEDEKD